MIVTQKPYASTPVPENISAFAVMDMQAMEKNVSVSNFGRPYFFRTLFHMPTVHSQNITKKSDKFSYSTQIPIHRYIHHIV